MAQVLAIVCLLVAVVPFVVFAVPQTVGAEHSYVVLSGSMEPYMAAGDVVIVDEVDPEGVAVGDVITYSRDGGRSTTTHRVVGFVETDADGRTIQTKGDANPTQDPYLVRRSQVVGEVAYVIPYIGYVVGFVGTRFGQVLLVAVPFGLLLLGEVWGRVARPTSTDSGPAASSESGGDAAAATPGVAKRDDHPAESAAGVTIGGVDLSLSAVLLVVLVGYSGWNAYRSITAAAPDLPSVMIFAGSATGLILVGGTLLSTALAESSAGAADEDPSTEDAVAEVDESDGQGKSDRETVADGGSAVDSADSDRRSREFQFPGGHGSPARWPSWRLEPFDENGSSGVTLRSDGTDGAAEDSGDKS